MSDDPFDLRRFVDAQGLVLDDVRAELARGRKRSHWMWFVFPQLEGLGSSSMARRYAIRSLDEARAYAAHAVLGPRLVECTQLALGVPDRTAHDIFGWPDDLKFRSCMTLFAQTGTSDVYRRALERFFDGKGDPATIDGLAAR